MSNPEQFQQFMEQGVNAAWEGNWEGAIAAYSQALQINSDDPDANSNLGLALLNVGQLDRALKFYKRAHQLLPDDPEPLERSADILERMEKHEEAAEQYSKVSEVYLSKRRDINKAIENWTRATELNPGMTSVFARLAQAHERIGNKPEAIKAYLIMAYNFQEAGDTQKAVRAVERGLRLDKKHAQSLNILRALKSGGKVVLPDGFIATSPPKPRPLAGSPFGFDETTDDRDVGEAHPLGPLGEAMDEALEILAQHVVESGLNEYVMFAMQGMEHQRQDLNEEAIAAYKQADDSGLRHPSLKLNLGGLLLLADQPEAAIPHLQEASSIVELSPGAMHGIGQAYVKLGKHKDASGFLIRSLRAVDTSLAADQAEVDELNSVYDNLLTTLEGRTPETLEVINERFVGLLSGKDWKQRIPETRRHLDETLRDEPGGVVDFLVAKGGDDLADQVASIDRFIRQGLYTLAMDESHRTVEKSPFYLPVHVRMAEVMMKEGRIRQAINKYNMVAKAYLMREENDRAASILSEVLEMAPLDVEVRLNLIHLLEEENRMDEALDQYVDLAETYQQLGDFDRASQTFDDAEKLAGEIGVEAGKIVQIKHSIADINQMRLNTRAAQSIYEEILTLQSDDVKALRALVDIYYTQGNRVEAVKLLDKLLGIFAKAGRVDEIVRMLEDLVHTNPTDTAIRQRLAQIYRKRGQKAEAIAQLDALGELQLDAGLTDEAAKTIKLIISIGPERVEEYQRLLAQLGG